MADTVIFPTGNAQRTYVVNGVALVVVRFGLHYDLGTPRNLLELGLSVDQIRIAPRWYHKDLQTDDFGPNVPPDMLWQLAEANIVMRLVNYDPFCLDLCMVESMCGPPPGDISGGSVAPPYVLNGLPYQAGHGLAGCGIPMGKGRPLGASGNRYVSLNIQSPAFGLPWRFPASYLTAPPLEMPLGNEKSIVTLNWRAIPYDVPRATGETESQNTTVWDHVLD